MRGMQFKIRYVCAIVVIIIYIFIKSVYFPTQISHEKSPLSHNKYLPSRTQNSTMDVTYTKKNITLLVRYSGGNAVYLSNTINSFADTFPNVQIIIVSDSVIPQPAVNFTSHANIKTVVLKLDLLNLLVDRNPLNYVKTKYLMIVPLGVVALQPRQISSLLSSMKSSYSLMVIPVENKNVDCITMDLNLKEWTLELKLNKFETVCDYFNVDIGIFAETSKLKQISEPFMAPFPEPLFIQAKSLGLQIQLSAVTLVRMKNYVMDNHWKHVLQHQRTFMYMQFGIKKVVRETGLTEWYGCTRNSKRCFGSVVDSMPSYLYQGRWTPPCCLRVLRETTHHVLKVLTKWNVHYWLEGGSLLGAMRSKDIIPWDYDVDIGIYQQDLKKCPWLLKAHKQKIKGSKTPVVDEDGYVWEAAKTDEGSFFRVQSSLKNTLHVDIFPFYSKDGIMTKDTWFLSHPQDREFPEHYLKPLTTVEFAGVNASAPNNIREFLEFKFGKGCVENPQYPNPKLMPFPQQYRPEQEEFNNY